ncbi:MAG: DUF3617 family protein [Rubrivivax sp.]|nr:DUF3617 family protein [Rubrivivax sp.]
MSDAPPTAGAWRMEMPGMDKAAAARIGGSMTVCQTAAEAMVRDDRKQDKSKPACNMKLTEDTATKAVMEMRCPDQASRMTITRVAPRSYEMEMQNLAKPSDAPMRMKMTYTGPCSKSDSVISMDKDSPACKQMRTQLPQIEKARASCAKAGANRASCEQMVAQQRAQIASMCGP